LILISIETKRPESRKALWWIFRSSRIFYTEYHRVQMNIIKILRRMENVAVYWHELPIASLPDHNDQNQSKMDAITKGNELK